MIAGDDSSMAGQVMRDRHKIKLHRHIMGRREAYRSLDSLPGHRDVQIPRQNGRDGDPPMVDGIGKRDAWGSVASFDPNRDS